MNALACGTTTSVQYRSDSKSEVKPIKVLFTSLVLVVKSDVPGSDEEVRLFDRFLSTDPVTMGSENRRSDKTEI